MKTVLAVENLGKCYFSYRSNWHRFASWFGTPVKPTATFWAAKGVSFTLAQGEAIALIGQNGAGKSTLLKLITGTVRPTEGSVHVDGRVSAILELGLGFNPELTGRINATHSAGLLGFSPNEIERLLPEIEAFAEIGEHFDQPLRTYSSGMQARLAFSLATAVRPEVLIVDEVLSVGDSYFQHKSFSRIRQFREEGSTIVLVTHSLSDVRTLCDRAILIDKGRAVREGAPDEVCDFYNAMIAEKENAKLSIEQRRVRGGWSWTRSGTFAAVVCSALLGDAATGEEIYVAKVGQLLRLAVTVEVKTDLSSLVLGVLIRDRSGHIVWGTNTHHTKQAIDKVCAGESIEYEVDILCELGPGSYSLTYALTETESHVAANYEWIDNAIIFDVINVGSPFFTGTCRLNAAFRVNRRPSKSEASRVAMTASCRDCDAIPKCERAGATEQDGDALVQIMHNGLKVVKGGYYGEWMAQVIEMLQGHHEPQEELVFHHLLQHVRPNSLIVELGAYWAYYALWYLKRVRGSRAVCVEPDPNNIRIGQRNSKLNKMDDRIRWFEAWIGERDEETHSAFVESLGAPRALPMLDASALLDLVGDENVELLHADVQGAELPFVRSLKSIVERRRIRFLAISTHHASISGSATTHKDVINVLMDMGACVLAQHDIAESYSGDGLVVASLYEGDRNITLPEISRNTQANCLFPSG